MRGLRDEVQLSDGGIIIVNNKINREIFDAVNARAKKPRADPNCAMFQLLVDFYLLFVWLSNAKIVSQIAKFLWRASFLLLTQS